MTALAEMQNDKLKGFETQLSALKTDTAAVDKQQNAQLEQLTSQTTQLKTALTADMTALAEMQNDKLKGFETQLSALKTDSAAVDKQQNAQLGRLSDKTSQIETALLSLKTAASDPQNNPTEELGHPSTQLDTSLKGDTKAPISEQSDKTQ
jgi:hypothetical protein